MLNLTLSQVISLKPTDFVQLTLGMQKAFFFQQIQLYFPRFLLLVSSFKDCQGKLFVLRSHKAKLIFINADGNNFATFLVTLSITFVSYLQ